MKKLKAIDVFCGCGGTTQGLKDAGFRVIAGIENDSLAAATYRMNHIGTKLWEEDIRFSTPENLRAHHNLEKGQLDLLTGCPPCQAFSSMRSLNGKKRIYDPESKDLIFDFMRFVKEFYPKVVMIENVPRLVNDYRFKAILRDLHSLGYRGKPAILDAADYGVPQRRRRMVFIASRIGDPVHCPSSRSAALTTVRDAISNLPPPGLSGDELHDFPAKHGSFVMDIIEKIPKNGGSRGILGEGSQLSCHRRCTGFKDVYGRMAWDSVSPTITCGCVNPSKGRFLHPEENRAITLREAALLQSFPVDYRFSTQKGKYKVAEMIGNAFPPRFVLYHASRIRDLIETTSTAGVS